MDGTYKPFSFTYVLYKSGDRLGQALALVSLLPVFAMVSYATLFLARRDLHILTLTAGHVVNEIINYVLKNTIKEPRPPHPFPQHHDNVPAFGMPSDHSQFCGFAASYITLWLTFARASRAASRGRVAAAGRTATACCAIVAWLACGAVAWSRVYLGYHSVSQVAAGVCLGAAVGASWYVLTVSIFHPCSMRIVTFQTARLLLLRDCFLHAADITRLEFDAVSAPAMPYGVKKRSP
jgi:dolichyldiphosphatase